MNKNTDNMTVEVDGDLIFVTVAKYKLFYSYGKIGIDAYLLYSHLMFTARLQKTNSVHAKDVYLREGLGWGSARLLKAKNLLKELELIKTKQTLDENGKFGKTYIEVSTKTTPFEINQVTNNTATLNDVSRENRTRTTDNKCFNKEVKCLNEKEKNVDKSTFNEIKQLFTNQSRIHSGEEYYHDGKQAKAIKLLKSRYLEDKKKFFQNINKFSKMIKESGNNYYMSLPLDPHTFNSNYNAILSFEFKEKEKPFIAYDGFQESVRENMSKEQISQLLNQKQIGG